LDVKLFLAPEKQTPTTESTGFKKKTASKSSIYIVFTESQNGTGWKGPLWVI